jgi:exopolysaccharide biosynthesis polyprenyl glycosylphosphotransferase
LPHTSEQGAKAFLHSISGATARLPIVITSGTYPDDLFDHLMCDVGHTTDALMHVTDSPALRSPASLAVKRVLDVVGALAGLILFSPFMLAAAFAVALGSPGPVIFRQTRLGKGGVPFVFYKFRSMYTDADDRMHREYVANLIEGNLDKINQGDAQRPLYKIAVDPRITRVGRFIRKTSLDELPQLINVALKGNLSLVGPRPHALQAKAADRLYEQVVDGYFARHRVKPGITGWAQVSGWRGETDTQEKLERRVEHDLYYIENWSVVFDLYILALTPLRLLSTENAY